MAGTVVGLAGLYLFFKIVVPLLLLAAVVYFAYQWANGPHQHEFSSAEPDEYREIDDDISSGPMPPRV